MTLHDVFQDDHIDEDSSEDKAALVIKEYEDFAYIVSHDLNAPLRHVKEFTRLLIGSRKNLNEQEKEYVEYLEKSLRKLEDMQHALLMFSRLNTQAGSLKETNFNHALSLALEELEDVINTSFPAFECEDLPTTMAESKQIQLLFYHLIDNALKFHKEDAQKRKVSISATDQGDTWLFEIRDNGIGIEQEYHEEIFRMFRRLAPDKYPGIGAGLTIAHKIVQRHDGEMIIESEPGEGTSVFFSIPKHNM